MMSSASPESSRPPVSAALEVKALTPDLRTVWDAYVLAHPDGTFFHLSAWESVLAEAFGHRSHYLLCLAGDRLCGVLPLAEIRSLVFGHSLVSTPFCAYGGILADSEDSKRLLEAQAIERALALRVDYLEMRSRKQQHPDWPYRDLYVTFRKPMSENMENNLRAIPNRQRAMIRKGARNSLQWCLDDHVNRHYAMYSESLRNLGTPVFAKRYLEILKRTFGDQCEVCTATHEGKAIASVMSFYFREEVLPYYGGGTQAARELAGNDFLYWHVMENARQRGARLFDYGRSRRGTGSYNFKKYWGFTPEPLFYEYFLVRSRKAPNLSPVNPRYQALISIWRKLPLPVTRVVGPWLARALG